MTVPIQIQPNSPLHKLRKRYGRNRRNHIQALERTVMDIERERDAALYMLERQRRVLSRLWINLEELQ